MIGIILNDKEDLFFGILQNEGGPCGVIGALQAFVLKYIIFHNDLSEFGECEMKERERIRWNCVYLGISEILYQLNGEWVFMVCVDDKKSVEGRVARIDECLGRRVEVSSLLDVFKQVAEFGEEFRSEQGVALLLYSVILTKGVSQIQEEMDDKEVPLIGQHSHCQQELVNLLLTGTASSNCFDGDQIVDHNYRLKGIQSQSQIGFLSIFEHYQYLTIGQNYKTPLYPIWLVSKEFHYSLIFTTHSTLLTQEVHSFDLIYYDQLYTHNQFIKLTLTKSHPANLKSSNQHDLTPLLDLLILTKFPDYYISWNDTVPIL